MIVAKQIHKKYGHLEVLKGVDVHVKEKEVVAITGPSGAGKTSLLQIIGTLDKPSTNDRTSLTIDGEDVIGMKDKRLSFFRNQKIGFVFQSHQLLPEFTALENVMIPGLIGGIPQVSLKKEATKLLDYLRLSERHHHKPTALSGGEQQRVAVARALVNQPKVVLADEPSGNLDTDTAEHLHQLFFDLRNDFGYSFVIVTHNQRLAKMSDRSIEIRDGMIV